MITIDCFYVLCTAVKTKFYAVLNNRKITIWLIKNTMFTTKKTLKICVTKNIKVLPNELNFSIYEKSVYIQWNIGNSSQDSFMYQ